MSYRKPEQLEQSASLASLADQQHVVRFLKSVCDESQACAKELNTLELQAIIPCARKKLWAIWQDTLSYDMKTKKIVEKFVTCTVSTAPNAKVAWHLLKVVLRVAG
ncbi:uncharacterized protein [Dermacentor albipictus]|uniref:uncharacterized protein n=1 Tax=Dermacentor albipictus TaxID=60249 RepID=UPI0038FC920C